MSAWFSRHFYAEFVVICMFCEMFQLEKMEKERMKRVVLNIHERQEEEAYQGPSSPLHCLAIDIKRSD